MAVTIPISFYVPLSGLDRYADRLPMPDGRVSVVISRNHGVVLTAWGVVVLALITQRFWSFRVLVGR